MVPRSRGPWLHRTICSWDCAQSGEWVGYSGHGTAFLLCFLLLGCQGSLENARDSECIAAQCSDSTVSEVTLEEETEEGSGGGKAVAEAAALAGGSQAEGPSRGWPGLCFSFCGGGEHWAGAMWPLLSAQAGRGQCNEGILRAWWSHVQAQVIPCPGNDFQNLF